MIYARSLVGAMTRDLGEVTEGFARDALILIVRTVFFQNLAKFQGTRPDPVTHLTVNHFLQIVIEPLSCAREGSF